MNNFFYSRYKTLILSFIVFLCLMTALLGLNYYAMYQVSSNSSIVDGIGELSDELYNLNLHTQKLKIADTDEERKKAMNAVITSRRIAGKYVELFEKGGDYHYDNGEKIFIPKLEDEADVENYRQLKAWWVDYEKKLDMVSAGEDVEPVADHIYDSKDFLYTLVNNIWTNQFDKVDYWNKYAKKALFAGVFLALLYLCWFIFYFLKKLNHSDENLKTARCQTTRILETVQDGLFLIDKNFIVSEVHSKNLEKILQRNNIAGQNLVELLQEMVGKDNIEEVKLFIEQLYNPWVVPELIEDLNPLKKIRVGFLSEEGELVVKYLSFTFLRVQDCSDDEIEQIFVNVVDVTDSMLLEQTLESEKIQHNRQIEMIGYILNIETELLNQFIVSMYERVDDMNEILRNEGQLHNKAQALLRKMHALKGEASAIGMDNFVSLAEQGETELAILRKQTAMAGQDFLGFAEVLNDLLDLTQFVETLLARLARVAQVQSTQEQTSQQDVETDLEQAGLESHGYWEQYFQNYAYEVAKRQGKNVVMNVTGFNDIKLRDTASRFCQDVGIQLIKNAIVHGIETSDERQAVGKNRTGQITLMLSNYGNQLRMSIIDDGAGINVEALRQKAVDLEMVSEQVAAELPDSKLYPLMFRSGISTVATINEDAGRGVGMDVVKDWVKKMNGKVRVESKRGANTKITINFDPE